MKKAVHKSNPKIYVYLEITVFGWLSKHIVDVTLRRVDRAVCLWGTHDGNGMRCPSTVWCFSSKSALLFSLPNMIGCHGFFSPHSLSDTHTHTLKFSNNFVESLFQEEWCSLEQTSVVFYLWLCVSPSFPDGFQDCKLYTWDEYQNCRL